MTVEEIMEQVCELCHWPYVEAESDLEERCERCPVEAALRRLENKEV